MKPRTKLQYQVCEYAKYHLYPKSKEIIGFAKNECLEHKAFATKRKVYCLDCGQSLEVSSIYRKRIFCPYCQRKLKVEYTSKRTYSQKIYIALAETVGEFQVIRNYEIKAIYKLKEKSQYHAREILQHWISPNNKREVIALRHHVNWGSDSWVGMLELRNKNDRKYFHPGSIYEVYPDYYHPLSRFKTEYEKYGFSSDLEGISFVEAIDSVKQSPKAETLLKTKQFYLLSTFLGNTSSRSFIERNWSTIKICMRNKYKISDFSIYKDYIDLLSFLRKDLHNAHYVCPKDLKKEHDLLVAKKRKVQQMQEAERKRKKLLEDEKTFKKLRSEFFGIRIFSGEIEIKMLESVQEIMEEGDALHHCVFTNGYYLRPDSLILSAMVNGVKTETVEVSLKEFKVVQCRGLQNDNSKYHDQIISLVEKNMNLIIERINPKRKHQPRFESQFIQVAV